MFFPIKIADYHVKLEIETENKKNVTKLRS